MAKSSENSYIKTDVIDSQQYQLGQIADFPPLLWTFICKKLKNTFFYKIFIHLENHVHTAALDKVSLKIGFLSSIY